MILLNILKDPVQKAIKSIAITALVIAFIISFSVPASADIVNIDAYGTTFEPAQIDVLPGDVIHFKIKKSPPHNVVFDRRGPSDLSEISHREMVMSGGFDIAIPEDAEPGTYQYWCDPHQALGMIGHITVKDRANQRV